MLNLVLFGSNGHQLNAKQIDAVHGAKLYGICDVDTDAFQDVKVFESLDEIISDEKVDIVSMCCGKRSEQADNILKVVNAKKHVYAEKPLVMTNDKLDTIIERAKENSVFVGEMCGTAFGEPYLSLKRTIENMNLGDIVQVYIQKSYPYGDWRPQDEDIDGGLIRQNAIHALRILNHTLSLEVENMQAVQTGKGNRKNGGLKMAVSMLFSLKNGAVATVNANYLNPKGYGCWGNERVIVFCARGSVETDIMSKSIKVSTDEFSESLDWLDDINYFQLVIDYLNGIIDRPFTIEREFTPTRLANELCEKVLNV